MSNVPQQQSSGRIYLIDSSHQDKPGYTHLYTTLARNLIQVFGLLFTEKSKQTFWPPQPCGVNG